MTRGQTKSTALIARLVWGRLADADQELAVLGDLELVDGAARALVMGASSDRFEVTVRWVGDRRTRSQAAALEGRQLVSAALTNGGRW